MQSDIALKVRSRPLTGQEMLTTPSRDFHPVGCKSKLETQAPGGSMIDTSHQGERAALIRVGRVSMPCTLSWPERPSGIVLFSHDIGSGQLCPGDRFLAARMRHEGLATLLVDLLGPRESGNPAKAFDMALLARRLRAAATWLTETVGFKDLPLGVCGTGTGAAAALVAAAEVPEMFQALVLLGARTDRAEFAWSKITAPTLMVVGGLDWETLVASREAMGEFLGPTRLLEVPGATRGMKEVGALEHAARWAAEWFVHYLSLESAWQPWSAPHSGSLVSHQAF
jgi:putative phosphoribosyl transferase